MTRKAMLGYLDSAAVEAVTIQGTAYEVRGLSLAQMRDLVRKATKNGEVQVERYQALVLIESVFDEKGDRVFEAADLDMLLAAPAGRLTKLIAASTRVNGDDDAPLDVSGDGSSS